LRPWRTSGATVRRTQYDVRTPAVVVMVFASFEAFMAFAFSLAVEKQICQIWQYSIKSFL
jgi:hypothetical protein